MAFVNDEVDISESPVKHLMLTGGDVGELDSRKTTVELVSTSCRTLLEQLLYP